VAGGSAIKMWRGVEHDGMQERCPVSLHGDGPLNLHVSSNSTLQVRFDHDPHSVPGGRVEVLFSPTCDLGI